MNLKTFQADTMAKALARVRRELGGNAVILNTRTIKRSGFLGLRRRQVVEITAGSGINVLNQSQRRGVGKGSESVRSTGGQQKSQRRDRPANHQVIGRREGNGLEKELQVVRQMVTELVKENRRTHHQGVPEQLFWAYVSLVNQEVAEEVADTVVRQVRSQLKPDQLANEDLVRRVMLKAVEKMIPTAGPISAGRPGRPNVIAFVGPTGVGKTTTIAKLAANFRLRENKSVALITIDTYRIAAVDQLKTYANIINVPLKVVLSPEELRQAIEQMKQYHVILIDTAGRSQNDQLKLQELKSFFDLANVDETHLVLSSTASQRTLQATIHEFAGIGIDKVLFTKLDEAVGVGMLINVIKKLDRSISYITTGQNVPEDIEPGNGRRLARLLVDQCLETGGTTSRRQHSSFNIKG